MPNPKLEGLWTECVKAQKAEFDASNDADAAEEALRKARERLRISRQYSADARGRLNLAMAEDAGIPVDD